MGECQCWWALCLFLVLCSFSNADSTCKNSCKGAGGPFVEGNVYKYHLEGSTVTNLPGSSSDLATLGLTATAEVFAESSCQHTLKLSNVVVKGPDGKTYDGLNAKCAKPIKFSYKDGKLSELCSEEDDRGTALNIKRAVVSLLSSLKRKDSGIETGLEDDVFGICPTDFSFSKDGSKVLIRKNKNLNRCALREDFNFPFPSTPFQAVQSSFGAFETSPLLSAQLTVHQEVDNGVLKKATGEEVYVYRPLVNPEAGAIVKVTYTLTQIGSNPGSIPATVNSPRVVYYETTHDDDGVKNHEAIAASLQKATAALDPVASPEAAKKFADLVYVIEQGDKANILQAYKAAQGKAAKNLFLDALLYAGSADSVEAAAELLGSKQIPEESANRWYLDLNFVKHASRGSLTSLLPLLSGDKVPHQAYLGIGAVAGKFCRQHQQLCHIAPEYSALLTKLAEPLAGGCHVDSHDKENKIIASLKGLRNTQHLPDDVAQKVAQCAADKSAKSRVRVAAIEAFHADAAKSVLKQAATSILNDVEEDSELRIKAYLALVESPCPNVADTVKHLVDNEPINQVGSFVVSHLRNLRASVSPEKETAKQFLGNIISKKKYPIDQRKFSRNYEVSYSVDAVNVGAVGEVNRIFSQKSFLPRSVSLNLTTQIFGHSVNLAEVGLRAENLEWHLERYFGPKGLFKTKGVDILDDLADQAHDKLKKAKQTVEAHRPKRSVSKQEADAATNKVELGPDYKDRFTDLDLSIKLFGSDVAWVNYHYDKMDYDGLKKKFYNKIDEELDKTKSIDIDYKKARTLIDGGVTYPTGLGFGLKLKVNANSAVNIKINGKADVKAIFNNPKNAHVAFQVIPSGSFELSSLVAIDAHIVESGVKVSANLHSSTGSDITVKVLDGYGIDVKVGMPVKKEEILNFHSDVVSVVRENKGSEVETPIKFKVLRADHGGCFDQLKELTGLTICGEVSTPMEGYKVLSPAYGPSKASLRLEKDDDLTSYHFKAFYNNQQPDQVSFEVLLDTPNSKTNRKFSLSAQGSLKPQKHIQISLVAPFKQANFEGMVIDTENEQALSAKLVADGSEYSLKIGAHVSGDANHKKYEPLLEYKYPEAAKPERTWQIGRKGAAKGGKQHQSAVGVTGAIYVDKDPNTKYRKYKLESVALNLPKFKVTVDGVIIVDENSLTTDLKASYEKETFTFNSKIQRQTEHKYLAKIEFMPSQYPDLGGSIKWEYEKTPQKIKNILVVVHGSDLKSESSRVSITQLLEYKYDSVTSFEFHTENSVTYPILALSALAKGSATPKSAQYDVDLTYDKSQFKSKLDAKTGTKHPTDYSVDFEAKALENSIVLASKHDRESPTKSKFTNSLEMKPGGKYTLNGVSEVNAKPGNIYQSLEAEITMPQEPKSLKIKTEFKHNSKEEEVEFELTAGNKRVVDFELELEKKSEPCGEFKLSLPKYIESQGAFETVSGKSTGSFNVDIVKTGRKIEGKGEVTATQSHVKGSGELLWDAKKDPSKKFHIETDTTVAGKSIDSKTSVQILQYKSDLNVKGNLEGSLTDGTLAGEAEWVLPSGRVVVGKVHRTLQLGPQDNKIEATYELFDHAAKGAPPRKVTLKLAGKNIKPEKLQFDGQVDLTYVTPENKDLILHVIGKKVPHGADKWIISGQGSITGSLAKQPIHYKLNADVANQFLKAQLTPDQKFPPAHYDFELKVGSDISVNSNGKVNQEQLNHDIEVKLPADLPVTSFKWDTANTIRVIVPEGANKKVASNNAVHWNGDKFVKFNVEVNNGELEGHGKVTWESHKSSARTLTYKGIVDDKKHTGEVDVALQWEGKTADLSLKADVKSNPVHLSIVSNVPDHGKFQVDLSHKELEGGETRETELVIQKNDKKVAYHSLYSRSQTEPFIDISLELPEGKKSRVYAKIQKKNEHHSLVESKLIWFSRGGGSLDLKGEVNVNSIDDFLVKVFIDSPKLNLDKVEFEAVSQPTKSAEKSISFHGKSAGKEISGSLALVSKGVSPNVHYEGKGSLKIGENTHPLEFKLKTETDQKNKFKGEIDIKAGAHSYVGYTIIEKDDAKNVKTIDSSAKYCKDQNCKSDDIKVTSHYKGYGDFENTADIKLDLSTHLILEHPLILKSHSKKEGLTYDGNHEIEYGADKIQYHGYIKADHAGAELTLPKRVIATEVVYEFPKKQNSLKIEASFWLDKKAPREKTSLLLAVNANTHKDGASSTGEARFSTPGLKKDLSLKHDLSINLKDRVINAKLEADIFAQKNQKIVALYKAVGKKEKDGYSGTDNLRVESKGLNINAQLERKLAFTKSTFSYSLIGFYIDSKQAKRELTARVRFDSKSFSALVKIPEGTLYAADGTIEHSNKQFTVKGNYELLGYKVEEHTSVSDSRIALTLIQKSGNGHQFDLEGSLILGQTAEFNSKFDKKSLVSVGVALDEAHFLKSKHSYNTDVAKDLVKTVKENLVGIVKEATRIVTETGAKIAQEATDRTNSVHENLPNFTPAVEHYQKELQQMKEELNSNESVKDLITFLKNTFGTVFLQISAILEEITKTIHRMSTLLNEALHKTTESVKTLIPKVKKHFEEATEVLVELFDNILTHATNLLNGILDKIKEHEKDIEEIIDIASEALQDVGQFVAKSVEEFYKEAKDFVNMFWDQVKALPAYTMLKEKLQELKDYQVPEQFWEAYHEVTSNLVQLMPTPEIQTFLKTASELIEKILKKQPVNRSEVLQQLYTEFVSAFRSLIELLESLQPEQKKVAAPTNFIVPVVPSLGLFVTPPGIFRFSLLNWLRSTDLPSLSEIFHTYRPKHSPIDIIPPFKASAQLIGGTEFFTFDGKHYSFKGSCSYVLLKDVIDGNFTLVANMEAGKLKSITAFDHEHSIELLSDNKVVVDGKPSDLPAKAGDLHMWTYPGVGYGFATTSGLMYFCNNHLSTCAFSLNGFYFGKTRGLLGTYNNEPYDDNIVPEGKVAKSTGEFANAWKVNSQCPAGAAHDEPAPAAEECNSLFSGESSLRPCFSFANPENFRDACNRLVADASGDKKEKACNVALSYVGYCYYVHFVPINLPEHCGKCQAGGQSVAIGESTEVSAPQHAADVVFVVEQAVPNEELFQNLLTPLVATLTNDLKEKGITDVKFALIGYGAPDQHWPAVYTFSGKYDGFNGNNAGNIYFGKEREEKNKFSDRLQELKRRVQVEAGISKTAMAYREALNYPFRPEATKTIVGVTSSDCEEAILPFQTLRMIVHKLNLLKTGLTLNLIAPIKMEIEGKDEKAAGNIVGFDSTSVYNQGEGKKKVLKGDEEAFKNLKYHDDVCTNLALDTNGAVFSSLNFIKGKPNLRKNFIQVLSNKLTDSLTSIEVKKECKCELERGMIVRTKCKIVSSKEKESLTKGGVKGGVKG